MICTVYRHKRKKNGKIVMARLYRGRFRMDGETEVTEVSLNTADKRLAQQRLEELIRERQMEKQGLLAPRALREAAESEIGEHLAAYVADLTALNRDERYIYELKNRVLKLMRECQWTLLKDITPAAFQSWRARRNRSSKTHNEYLGSLSSFLNWMERNERIARNPIKHVQKVAPSTNRRRPRRAFADDEMARLLAVAGPRRVVYLAAVFTGLRRGELSAVERDDLHLEAEKPFVHARASTTKNGKDAVIALHPDVLPELRALLVSLPSRTKLVFADRMPTMDQFRADLKAAGIPFINEKGLRADFHSLRHTLGTNLLRKGTALRVAMEAMRHSDVRLTTKTYADAALLPVADAVLDLPSLVPQPKGGAKADTQIDTQNLFPEDPSPSTLVTSLEADEASEVSVDQGQTKAVTAQVMTCQENGKGGQNRIRTCPAFAGSS